MSRTTVVRRLTAVFALVAVLCLALPAAAAAGARQQSPRTPVVYTSGLFDQLLSWLGTLLPGPSAPQGSTGRTEKAVTGAPLGSPTDTLPLHQDADRGSQIDPNG